MTTARTRRAGWTAMIAFTAVGAVTQLLWLTYAPVTDVAAAHYGVSATAVGWLANVFPLWYVVLAIPAGLALDRWPRATVAVGAVLTAAGAVVRLSADDYAAAMIGQNLVAIAQPLVLTAITPLAARYLSARDRPTGIAVASAGTFAGMIAAFVLSALVELRAALLVGAVVAVVAGAVLVVALREPPAFAVDGPSGGLRDFAAAWRNPVVRRMCVLVVVPFGTFTALTTWGQPLLQPAGVSADEAGILLVLNVAAGVLGCAVVPVLAARTGRRRLALALGVVATVLGCVVLALAPSFATGLAAFALVGALLLPALPIVLEVSERAAPASAGAAAGLVWMAGQLGALVVTGVVGAVLDTPTAAFLLLAALTAIAFALLPRAASLEPSAVSDEYS